MAVRRRVAWFGLLAGLSIHSAGADAQEKLYKWVDAQEVLHMTTDASRIPLAPGTSVEGEVLGQEGVRAEDRIAPAHTPPVRELGGPGHGGLHPPLGKPRNDVRLGRFGTTFDERSQLSSEAARMDRVVDRSDFEGEYDLAVESFDVYVPPSYANGGGTPFGLVVWVNAGDGGGPPAHIVPVLEKHKLIWVGAGKSGNNRVRGCRVGLALDAVHNMKKLYRIEPSRVYASGSSGGGRVASMIGVIYPDLFTGAFPIVGCNYFADLQIPSDPGRRWSAPYRVADSPRLAQAKGRTRFVLLTGESDANREQTTVTFTQMKKDGFRHVTCLVVPGMGHDMPNAEWFEKGILALDAR